MEDESYDYPKLVQKEVSKAPASKTRDRNRTTWVVNDVQNIESPTVEEGIMLTTRWEC